MFQETVTGEDFQRMLWRSGSVLCRVGRYEIIPEGCECEPEKINCECEGMTYRAVAESNYLGGEHEFPTIAEAVAFLGDLWERAENAREASIHA